MAGGVTLIKPETVTIDSAVEIGMDTIVEPFAQILGKTTIGENCRIGACSIVQDSELADEVEIGAFTVVNTSTLERGAHAGPFARLRMDNHVEAGAHIGNFVELKKTRMGAGAKASHLAYLGDSDIGAEVNIGAGTITCNYDGFKKHPTRIGEGAFVGSNSTLVAPIEIGAGSYVAAGSVITEAVPAGRAGDRPGTAGKQAGMGPEAAQPGQDGGWGEERRLKPYSGPQNAGVVVHARSRTSSSDRRRSPARNSKALPPWWLRPLR